MKKHAKTKKGCLFIENVVEPASTNSPSFASVYPEAALLWDYKQNCGFGPEDFSYGSSVRAWFKCPVAKDHVFETLSILALRNQGCHLNSRLNVPLIVVPRIAVDCHQVRLQV